MGRGGLPPASYLEDHPQLLADPTTLTWCSSKEGSNALTGDPVVAHAPGLTAQTWADPLQPRRLRALSATIRNQPGRLIRRPVEVQSGVLLWETLFHIAARLLSG
jgi:hypothetical protein